MLPKRAYAIVRIDDYLKDLDIPKQNMITVKKIVWSMETAVNEVRRLNNLNESKGCLYFWQYTRIDPNIVPAVHVVDEPET
jgi:hypothetical protein